MLVCITAVIASQKPGKGATRGARDTSLRKSMANIPFTIIVRTHVSCDVIALYRVRSRCGFLTSLGSSGIPLLRPVVSCDLVP